MNKRMSEVVEERENEITFIVIPGLTRNPVTLPFYYIKTGNYELPIKKT